MNRKIKLLFSWIEVVFWICVLLILARFTLEREFHSLFHAFGISENWVYVFTVPCAFLRYYCIFQEEKTKANKSGKAVVRKPVLLGAALVILAVILYLAIINMG
jgi:uncharacterized membrane protein YdfJ with MMPL/SSD domain